MTLPIPHFYDAANATLWNYRPDLGKLFDVSQEWRKTHNIPGAGGQKANIHLLLIDMQKDFCYPEGTLFAGGRSGRGALEDNDRLARFIYENLAHLKEITTTLDTHFAHQIFFPTFWKDRDGKPLAPHRTVTTKDIVNGEVEPNPAVARFVCEGDLTWLRKQVHCYCEELEKAGKYDLYLWPFHCIIGSGGHALAGVIEEARMFHAFTRGCQSEVEIKGGHPLTENYSVLSPEVLKRHDDKGTLGQRNTDFIKKLLDSDAVIIAGQAASHCVKFTIDDLLESIMAKDPALVKKVYLLRDCMSSVAVPDGKGGFAMDFTPEAEKALKRFADAGMHVVSSTDPMSKWDGLGL